MRIEILLFLGSILFVGAIAPGAWPVFVDGVAWWYGAFMALQGEGRGVVIAGLLALVGVPGTLFQNARQQRAAFRHQFELSQIEAAKHQAALESELAI